jgi:hypothetical protein
MDPKLTKARLRAKNDAATALRKLIDWCLEEGMTESADLLRDAARVTATIAKSLEARTK